jgi:hypothetical protein
VKDGYNTLEDGEVIYYISNPALGLWRGQEGSSDQISLRSAVNTATALFVLLRRIRSGKEIRSWNSGHCFLAGWKRLYASRGRQFRRPVAGF